MKIFTLAAGLATGYVLGSRAGRERYEQIVAQYQKLTNHPSVVQAQEKTKQAVISRVDEAITTLDPTAPTDPPELSASVSPARPSRRKTSSSTKRGRSVEPLA